MASHEWVNSHKCNHIGRLAGPIPLIVTPWKTPSCSRLRVTRGATPRIGDSSQEGVLATLSRCCSSPSYSRKDQLSQPNRKYNRSLASVMSAGMGLDRVRQATPISAMAMKMVCVCLWHKTQGNSHSSSQTKEVWRDLADTQGKKMW